MRGVLSFLVMCCLVACQSNEKKSEPVKTVPKPIKTVPVIDKGSIEFEGLIDVQSLNKDIFCELKYATDDNFMGFQLYHSIKRPYLQPDVAERLSKCQDYLSEIDSSLHLLIYDAARPVSVQKLMWDALDSIPPGLRGRYVSNPGHRSLHNLGAAVDITICDDRRVVMDMGAGFDEFAEIAYPRMEYHFLKTGELSQQQYDNRLLLRRVMKSQRFRQLPTEWWHYNAYSRDVARTKYKVLWTEPDSLSND
ncbi:M15 family metallopeptidase [Crocinitomicaceae bacterium]|nr:M15 family metallopeptidase [Crocinitomicaceae bacterium]